jgi:ubiquitin-like modifier-activating enzyme ATG7
MRINIHRSQVLYEYGRRGMDFVVYAINEPTYLEDLIGLTELMKLASDCQVKWIDESDEDEFVEI